MPDGSYRTGREWRRLESPLLELDPALDAYATRHGFSITRSYHSWPQRALIWGDFIKRSVQISVANEHDLRLNISAVAWQDDGSRRHWRNQVIRSSALVSQLQDRFAAILDSAVQRANSWSHRDLSLVT